MPVFSFGGFVGASLEWLAGHPLVFIAVILTAASVALRLVYLADAARTEAREYLQDAYLRAQREQIARLDKKMARVELVQECADRACGITETGIDSSHDLPKRA